MIRTILALTKAVIMTPITAVADVVDMDCPPSDKTARLWRNVGKAIDKDIKS